MNTRHGRVAPSTLGAAPQPRLHPLPCPLKCQHRRGADACPVSPGANCYKFIIPTAKSRRCSGGRPLTAERNSAGPTGEQSMARSASPVGTRFPAKYRRAVSTSQPTIEARLSDAFAGKASCTARMTEKIFGRTVGRPADWRVASAAVMVLRCPPWKRRRIFKAGERRQRSPCPSIGISLAPPKEAVEIILRPPAAAVRRTDRAAAPTWKLCRKWRGRWRPHARR